MSRSIGVLVSLFWLLSLPVVSAQVMQSDAVPPLQVLGPELIAWSQLQQPQPVSRLTDRTERDRPASQDGTIKDSRGDRGNERAHSIVHITGLITVVGGQWQLKVANDITLQLDDQQKARQYEGRQVKVAGMLDERDGKLYVMSIELDS